MPRPPRGGFALRLLLLRLHRSATRIEWTFVPSAQPHRARAWRRAAHTSVCHRHYTADMARDSGSARARSRVSPAAMRVIVAESLRLELRRGAAPRPQSFAKAGVDDGGQLRFAQSRLTDRDLAIATRVGHYVERREPVRDRLESRRGSSEEAPDRNAWQRARDEGTSKTDRFQGNRDSWRQAAAPRALMVRKGSPVRVRQRALRKPAGNGGFRRSGVARSRATWAAMEAFGSSWRRSTPLRSSADCRRRHSVASERGSGQRSLSGCARDLVSRSRGSQGNCRA